MKGKELKKKFAVAAVSAMLVASYAIPTFADDSAEPLENGEQVTTEQSQEAEEPAVEETKEESTQAAEEVKEEAAPVKEAAKEEAAPAKEEASVVASKALKTAATAKTVEMSASSDSLGEITSWSLDCDYDDNGVIDDYEMQLVLLMYSKNIPYDLKLDINHDGLLNVADYTIWRQLTDGGISPSEAGIKVHVKDEPIDAYYKVSSIKATVDGKVIDLKVPDNGESATTGNFTVTMSGNGKATIEGLAGSTNDIQVSHSKLYDKTIQMTSSSDANGEITSSKLDGDLGDDKIITDDEILMLTKIIGNNVDDKVVDPNKELDIDGDGTHTSKDKIIYKAILEGTKLPSECGVETHVIDTPKEGYEVSAVKATIDGKVIDVKVPAKGETATGNGFTVVIDANGVATIDGLAGYLNDIQVSHSKILGHFDITFDTDGGSQIPAQNVTENDKVTKPADPTKDGYTFDKWVDDEGNEYDFDTPVTGEITLHATWIQNDDDPADNNNTGNDDDPADNNNTGNDDDAIDNNTGNDSDVAENNNTGNDSDIAENNSEEPKTGDQSDIMAWLALALAGTAAAGTTLVAKKKSSKEEK